MAHLCYHPKCEDELPEKYYRVIRIIKSGNKRKRYNFCCVECMLDFFGKLSANWGKRPLIIDCKDCEEKFVWTTEDGKRIKFCPYCGSKNLAKTEEESW